MSAKAKKVLKVIALAVAGLLVIAAATFGIVSCTRSSDVSADTSADVPWITPDINEIADLGYSREWSRNSMPENSLRRTQLLQNSIEGQFSDAVSEPFTTVMNGDRAKSDAEIMADWASLTADEAEEFLNATYDEFREELARDPVDLDEATHWLAKQVEPHTGKPMIEANPWIQEWINMVDEFMAVPVYKTDENGNVLYEADENGQQVPVKNHPRGWERFLTQNTEDGKIYVTDEYLSYAKRVIWLFDQLVKNGIYDNPMNSWYLPWNSDSPTVRTAFSVVEGRPYMLLQYVLKDGTVKVVVGINLLDKRLEEPYEPEPPAASTPPGETPPWSPWTPPPTPGYKDPGQGTEDPDPQDQGRYDNQPGEEAKPPVDKLPAEIVERSTTYWTDWSTTETFTQVEGDYNVTYAKQVMIQWKETWKVDTGTNAEVAGSRAKTQIGSDSRTIEVSRNVIDQGGDGGGFEPPAGR
jgi:hypothetical protein